MKVCIEARVMLTSNFKTSDCLINWSTGIVEYMQMPRAGNNLVGNMYVKFGDEDAGNYLKNNGLRDELE